MPQVTINSSTPHNVVTTRRLVQLVNARKLDAASRCFDRRCLYHGPGGQELEGRTGIRALWDLFFGAFPDLTSTVDETICEGHTVVLRCRNRGTHTGEFLGIPASNRSITLPVLRVFRVDGEALLEIWELYDRLHLLEQIGGGAFDER